MKGKYAARADRRRELKALEERAAEAERERDHLASEMARLKECSEQRIAGLRGELHAMQSARDKIAHPRIAQLEAINNRLRAERNSATEEAREQSRHQVNLGLRVQNALMATFGLSLADAREWLNAVADAPDMGKRFVSCGGVRGKDPRAVEAVQRLRGQRASVSPAREAAPEMKAVVWSRRDARDELAKMRNAAREACLPVFTYDGEDASLVVGAEVSGRLHFYIETAEGLADVAVPSDETAELARAITSNS